MHKDARELIARLSTAAGMIMEDASVSAVSLAGHQRKLRTTLSELQQATRDAALLLEAAQIVARRAN